MAPRIHDTFIPCNPPEKKNLAIFSPRGTLRRHAQELVDHTAYWAHELANAQDDSVRQQLASYLLQEFFTVVQNHTRRETSVHILECDRRRALGAMAMSLLLGKVLKHDIPLEDGKALGYTNIAVDAFADDRNMPLEPRLHAMPRDTEFLPHAENKTSWYRAGNFYIKRTIPAQPSDAMILFAQEHEMDVDFPALVTLFPYIGAR